MSQKKQSNPFNYHPSLFTEYRVQSGDTLSFIAYKLLGDSGWADIIYQVNRDTIGDNKNLIMVNQKLKIPVPVLDDGAQRHDFYHIIGEYGPQTLEDLADFYYGVESDYKLKKQEFIDGIAEANRIEKFSPEHNQDGIGKGAHILIPNIQAVDAQDTQLLYQFDSVNVWGRRWVNLMRSIKTTQQIASDLVDLSAGALRMVRDDYVSSVDDYMVPPEKDWADDIAPSDPGKGQAVVLSAAAEEEPDATEGIGDAISGVVDFVRNRFRDEDEVEEAGPDDDDLLVEPAYSEILTGNDDLLAEPDFDEVLTGSDDLLVEPAYSEIPTGSEVPPPGDTYIEMPTGDENPGGPLSDPADFGEVETLTDLFSAIEYDQLIIIHNILLNLGLFTDQELGPLVASLTPPHWRPTYHVKTPPSSLLREVLKQASADLNYLDSALHQRQRIFDQQGRGQISIQAATLYEADRLAFNALIPLKPFLPDDLVNVVTYYSENMHIRQIPYDKSTILIGLPFVSVSSHNDVLSYDELVDYDSEVLSQYESRLPYDYMAIPHEIGHFVYHFGRIDGELVVDNLTGRMLEQNRFEGWFEELFADTVGLYISGPLAVLGMQSMLVDAFSDELIYDDGYHPLAAMRPFIMSHILRKFHQHPAIAANLTHVPDQLDQNWENLLRLRGLIDPAKALNQADFTFNIHQNHADPLAAHHFSNRRSRSALRPKRQFDPKPKQQTARPETITLPELLSAIEPMINACVNMIANYVAPDMEDDVWAPWSTDLEAAERPLSDYDDVLEQLLAIEFPYYPIPQELTEVVAPEDRTIRMKQYEAEWRAREILNGWGDSGPKGGGART